MECFDISNVSSNHIVASMVRFTNGRPDNKAYRRYRIRTVDGQNDFASMSEVIRRRYSRILAESDAVASRQADMTLYQWLKKLSAEGKAPIKVPDLVVVDGGKGQLSSALADLEADVYKRQAHAWLTEGSGRITINRRGFEEYLPTVQLQNAVLQPFQVTNTMNKFDVNVVTKGGGIHGQVGAIRMAIARALVQVDEASRAQLRA